MNTVENAARNGFQHIALGAVGSTNDEAMARAMEGHPLPLWVTADRQLQGRGRQGAHWASETGNLYASLALTVEARCLPELPILAAVALHDALADILADNAGGGSPDGLAIKWPNDILYKGFKVSGILAESQSLSKAKPEPGASTVAVIGMGVNLRHHPDGTRYPATNLAAQGLSVHRDHLFSRLSHQFQRRLDEWQSEDEAGFQTIRGAWLERACGIGDVIEVRLPGETLTGRFDGMDRSGRLVLHQDGQPVRLVSAGEVFFSGQTLAGIPHVE